MSERKSLWSGEEGINRKLWLTHYMNKAQGNLNDAKLALVANRTDEMEESLRKAHRSLQNFDICYARLHVDRDNLRDFYEPEAAEIRERVERSKAIGY